MENKIKFYLVNKRTGFSHSQSSKCNDGVAIACPLFSQLQPSNIHTSMLARPIRLFI